MTPQPGADCWRIERADKASVVIDADTYFRHARAAMMKAKPTSTKYGIFCRDKRLYCAQYLRHYDP